jgi:hypothetical protein
MYIYVYICIYSINSSPPHHHLPSPHTTHTHPNTHKHTHTPFSPPQHTQESLLTHSAPCAPTRTSATWTPRVSASYVASTNRLILLYSYTHLHSYTHILIYSYTLIHICGINKQVFDRASNRHNYTE